MGKNEWPITKPTTDSLFELGFVVATPAALSAFESNGDNAYSYLERHSRGDWGNVAPRDAQQNNEAVDLGLQLLSVYNLADGTKFWIITEADRSATTLLLAREY